MVQAQWSGCPLGTHSHCDWRPQSGFVHPFFWTSSPETNAVHFRPGEMWAHLETLRRSGLKRPVLERAFGAFPSSSFEPEPDLYSGARPIPMCLLPRCWNKAVPRSIACDHCDRGETWRGGLYCLAICLSILNNRLASPPVFWRLL